MVHFYLGEVVYITVGGNKAIAAILSAIRQLMNPPPPKRRGIGFTADMEAKSPDE